MVSRAAKHVTRAENGEEIGGERQATSSAENSLQEISRCCASAAGSGFNFKGIFKGIPVNKLKV